MARIVVGIDGSAESRHALRWAFRESQLHDASLEVILAWGYLEQYRGGRSRFERFADGRAAAIALDDIVAETLSEADHGVVKPMAVDGFAAEALTDASFGAELLVVGPRGRGGFLGFRLGSVTERCLEAARCPVAVIHAGQEQPEGVPERVVVGVDGSAESHRALRWATDEAERRRARLSIVHAWIDPVRAETSDTGSTEASTVETAAWRMLDEAVAAVDVSRLPEPPGRRLVYGAAGAALTDAADAADLLVVGSRGLGGIKRMLLGSVASEVARHARCPVVVLRRNGAPE